MKTVNEVSRISGVSVRTLHHYDSIGLLKPTAVTEAGYRLYDDTALERLQNILLFRELQFPLKEIKSIIDSPQFNTREALEQQIKMLKLKREHIDNLISLADKMIENGDEYMDFSAFDKSEIEQYAEEAKQRWGNTDEYRESQKKAEGRTDSDNALIADGMMNIFRGIGKIKDTQPDSSEAQALVKKLQQYITDNYYNCTPQIFGCLGEMYVGDERFRENIDAAGGIGTAEFTAKAIKVFCNNK